MKQVSHKKLRGLLFFNALFSLMVAFSLSSAAQTTSISDIKANEDTTISIKKGAASDAARVYEVVEGSGEIEGDPNVLSKSARDEWKKSCEHWKEEIKGLNKENQILAISCNAPECRTETSGTICKSTGVYKIKVKVSK
jgi:hypothetical protein